MGRLTMSDTGNKYIIVFTVNLARFVIKKTIQKEKKTIKKTIQNYTNEKTIQKADADLTAQVFLEKVVFRHATPAMLVLIRPRKNYLSDLVNRICEISITQKVNTIPYHPQTDGLVKISTK